MPLDIYVLLCRHELHVSRAVFHPVAANSQICWITLLYGAAHEVEDRGYGRLSRACRPP